MFRTTSFKPGCCHYNAKSFNVSICMLLGLLPETSGVQLLWSTIVDAAFNALRCYATLIIPFLQACRNTFLVWIKQKYSKFALFKYSLNHLCDSLTINSFPLIRNSPIALYNKLSFQKSSIVHVYNFRSEKTF